MFDSENLYELIAENLKNNKEFILNYDITSLYKVSISESKLKDMGVKVEGKTKYIIFSKIK